MEIRVDSVFEEEFQKCALYAFEEFGTKAALNWNKQYSAIRHRLNLMPESFPPAAYFRKRTKVFRGAIIMKNFKIIYFYNEQKGILWLVDLWDMRQNPEKLKLRARARKIEHTRYN